MYVTLKFFAGLKIYLPNEDEPCRMLFEDGTTVGDVLSLLGVPPEKPRILLVNGRHAGRDHVLRDEDQLSVFPPVAGG